MIAFTILVGAGSIDLSAFQGGGDVIRLLVNAVVILAVAVTVAMIVPRWRQWTWNKVAGPARQMRDALSTLRNPRTALPALAGSIGTEVLYGAAFLCCVLAMGGSLTLGEGVAILPLAPGFVLYTGMLAIAQGDNSSARAALGDAGIISLAIAIGVALGLGFGRDTFAGARHVVTARQTQTSREPE